MVFDNADNLTPEELEEYFPPGLGGNTVDILTMHNAGPRIFLCIVRSYAR